MPIDLTTLNPEQYAAVQATDGPLLLLAGAGTGKTRALTYRIAHMVEDLRVSPYQILAITFTNKAAAEMRQRLAGLLSGGLRGMWVATFHAMCVRMLRMDAELVGHTRNFSIYDDDDSKRLMKDIYNALNLDAKKYAPAAVRERISSAKNELLGPADLGDSAANAYERLVARVYGALQDRLKRADAMDFDDLLVNTFKLLDKNPQVLEAYQERFRYLLIDEYQDTNHAQYRIASLLAAKYRNIMVVGDDDQSIYSWRGADIRNILEFEHDYPEAEVIKLERNYRSTSVILEAANAVIANNRERKAKRLFTEAAGGEQISLYQAADERDEGRWVAGEIERLRRAGRPYSDMAVFYRTNAQSRVLEDMLLRAGVPYRIVGGTRFFDRAEIRDLMAYLKLVVNPADDIACKRVLNTPRRGVGKSSQERIEDLQAVEGCTFFEACELMLADGGLSNAAARGTASFVQLIRDAARYEGSLRSIVENVAMASGLLSALENEGSDEAKSRIENIQEFFGVAEEFDAAHAEEEYDAEVGWQSGVSGDEAAAGGDEAVAGGDEAAAGGDAGGDAGVPYAAEAAASARPPYREAPLEDAAGGDAASLAEGGAQRDAEAPRSQLAAFMEWLALRSDLDTLVAGESTVTLMTVHSAKGLEFPVVFIAGLENTVFPHIASYDDNRGLEEERRLAYVAITRARELLYLAHAQVRSLYGKTNANGRSRFVAEIPAELLKMCGVGSNAYLGLGTEKRGSRHGTLGSGTAGRNGSGNATLSGSGSLAGTGRGGLAGRGGGGLRPGLNSESEGGHVFGGSSQGAQHVAAASGSKEPLHAGDEVDHKIFGRGKVQEAEGDVVVIRFANGQTKKLLADLAPIVRLK